MIIEYIIRFLAPHHCIACLKEGALLCTVCAQNLPFTPVKTDVIPYGAVYAATAYEDVAKRLVHALKFEYARTAAVDMGRCIVSRLPAGYCPEVITYVPTATSRVRARGYDQARLIARAAARELGVPCFPLLARIGQKRQVGNDKATRSQQMQGAFHCTRALAAKHVLLVDDVFTTGSTIQAASRTLHEAGARRVDVAVFAAAGTN